MSDLAVKDALEQYRARISVLKKGYGQEKYRIAQIGRSFLGGLVVREVTSVDIASYRDLRLSTVNLRMKRLLATTTVRQELSLLSNFFDVARIEWGLCDGNPVTNVRKPKCQPGRDRRLTPREERLILRYCLEHANPDLYSIVVLALETAMRQGEILNLHWEDLNFKTRIAHLPETKNGTPRDVPLSAKAREALMRLGMRSRGRVFGYTAGGFKSTWRFMLQKLRIENLHFHDLRHEAVSRLFELGSLDMMEVAAISGHKSLSMLKRYTHLKAQHLVQKLEGPKNRGRQAVLGSLIPYPAVIEAGDEAGEVRVRLLDFDGVAGVGRCRATAMRAAEDALLRRILRLMRAAQPIPAPDQYVETVDVTAVVMVDPLAEDD
ncbi:MAG: site-specific integrase [Azonexus sp.]|jgi:integrase|nr:site-specific integrase [Azonexus sp.]